MERPLSIFIIGTTAVGKTKLSIELCKAFGGQVVNCDSKQLYKYANIMTAKASTEEQEGIPHHMLSVLDLQETCYNRNKYFEEASKIVEDIKARGKIPVIIGGTNYYIETLLYQIGVPGQKEGIKDNEQNENVNDYNDQNNNDEQNENKPKRAGLITQSEIQAMEKIEKYQLLRKVDPTMAEKLHPNDEIRVTNFLLRYAETGKPPSLEYKPYIHLLRDKNSILFWIQNSDKEELHKMMSDRVEKMIEGEGLEEILSIFQYAKNNNCGQSMGGVLQSIGYKQFSQLFKEVSDTLNIPADKTDYTSIKEMMDGKTIQQVRNKCKTVEMPSIRTGKGVDILTRCKQILVKSTTDYARRQITWIKNRIFAEPDNVKHFFVLNLAGNNSLQVRFNDQIKEKAIQIIKKINVQGFGSIHEDLKHFKQQKPESLKEWKKYECKDCGIVANGKNQWNAHLNSKKHRQKDRRKKKQEKKAAKNSLKSKQ